mmetsp:Transcript_12366/g.29626  ORF Transcript_12366/g.29626 Transcript_12366/m.29626 type:complete len:277 (+) Transcript_12366:1855-2685(+)
MHVSELSETQPVVMHDVPASRACGPVSHFPKLCPKTESVEPPVAGSVLLDRDVTVGGRYRTDRSSLNARSSGANSFSVPATVICTVRKSPVPGERTQVMAVSEVHDTVWHAVLKASEPSYDAFRLAECRTLFALGGSPGLPQPVELHSSRSASKLHRVVHWNVPNISPRNVAVVPPLVGLAAREIDDTLGASNVKALGSTSTCPPLKSSMATMMGCPNPRPGATLHTMLLEDRHVSVTHSVARTLAPIAPSVLQQYGSPSRQPVHCEGWLAVRSQI